MIEVEFLEDTYIRRNLNSMIQTEIGYINSGESIEVEANPIQGQSRTHRIRGHAVTSNLWYTCQNGWYYWYGSTDIGYNQLTSEARVFVSQPQIDVSTIDLSRLARFTLPEPVINNNIIELFWKHKIFGANIRVAVLDSGYRRGFDNIADYKFDYRYGADEKKYGEPYIDDMNHGGKCLALMKYCSMSFIGLSPQIDLFFFQIKPTYSRDYEIIVKRLISAIKKCKQEGVHIVNISQALDRKRITDETYLLLQQAINDFSKTGIIICAGGNKNRSDWEHIVPAQCDNVLAVSSFSYKDGSIIDNSLFYDDINFRIENSKVVMPDGSGFGSSSCAAVIMSSYLALILSKVDKSRLSYIVQKLYRYKPPNKIFTVSKFLNQLQ